MRIPVAVIRIRGVWCLIWFEPESCQMVHVQPGCMKPMCSSVTLTCLCRRIRKLLYNNVTSEVTGSVFVLESYQATCENHEHRWYFCVCLDAQVWSEVNQAVLDYENRESTPKLAKLLKLLLWAQNELDQKKVKYPKMTDLSSGTIEDPKWTGTFHVPLIYDQSVTVWRQVTCINKCYIVFCFFFIFHSREVRLDALCKM